jgi:para-nitrobenzyl esterase
MRRRLYLRALFVAVAIVLGSLSWAIAQTETTVMVESGTIRGVASSDVVAFKGIPYAAPPVGDLRWRAPQPVAAWSGVRPAIEYGLDCMQKPLPGEAAASGGTFGEDCLFLNVWRPAVMTPDVRLPVFVWIHGGGFLNGGSSAPTFDGSALARQGLVVVSLNYRLGRLGFFMHPALAAGEEKELVVIVEVQS